MATKPQRPVRNGIIATVAGGLILAAILSLVPQLRDFFVKAMLWAWRIVTWVWAALFANYSAPGWAFLILGSFALVGLALLCVILWFQIKSEIGPASRNYTEDMLYGAKWRWSWDGDEISNLWCFCPRCDAQLVYSDGYTETSFICERCPPNGADRHYRSQGRVVATVEGGGRDYAVSAAEREILRRIRTGEFSSNS